MSVPFILGGLIYAAGTLAVIFQFPLYSFGWWVVVLIFSLFPIGCMDFYDRLQKRKNK